MIEIRRRISTPFSGVSGTPATVAEPEVGAMRVPSVRTVVVFPAPFGPRNPNTSPRPPSKEASWNATRSAKRLLRPWTDSAGAPLFRSGTATLPEVTKRSPNPRVRPLISLMATSTDRQHAASPARVGRLPGSSTMPLATVALLNCYHYAKHVVAATSREVVQMTAQAPGSPGQQLAPRQLAEHEAWSAPAARVLA